MKLADITDRILSASASIIAITALATGVYQAKLSRDQAKAAVWPYLIVGNSGNNGYSRIVQNLGVGPAIIRSFEVRVDSTVVHSWKEVADSLHVPLTFRNSRTTSFRAGLVIPAGSTVDLIELPDSTDIKLIRSQVGRLQTRVCFCSFYGDCWQLDDAIADPRGVKDCKDDPASRFRS